MLHIVDVALNGVLAALGLGGHGLGRGMVAGVLDDTTNLFFFYEIKQFIIYRIDRFAEHLLGRTMSIVGLSALAVTTLWILLKGFRIVTGQSQESMMGLLMGGLRVSLILFAATGFAAAGTPIVKVMADSTTQVIYSAITGKDLGEDPYSAIDKNLSYMQLAMMSIDLLDASGDEAIESAKTRAQVFNGIGIGGPALIGGTLLLVNRIAMALVVGFGPIFIMCLMFEQTKFLFGKWLMFGIGTLFSLGVLSVMVSLSLDIVAAVAQKFWIGGFIGANTEGISSMALQQGGLGLIMTLLMVTVPPMAASFFQGTLGQFSQVNAFAGYQLGGRHGPHPAQQASYLAQYRSSQQSAPQSPEQAASVSPGRYHGKSDANLSTMLNRQAVAPGRAAGGTGGPADPTSTSKVGLASPRNNDNEPLNA